MSRIPGSCVRYEYLGSIESIIANKVAASGFFGSLTFKLKTLTSLFSSKTSYVDSLHGHTSPDPDHRHATLLFESDA